MSSLDALDLTNSLSKHLIPKPRLVAAGILNYTLREVIELQTLLAQQGICMTLSTAEIQLLEGEQPSPPLPANAQ